MPPEQDWYRDAIVYELHVKAFHDANGDGVGDFRGLTERLDYLQDLGVTAIWLLPFYPSPLRDDGYDIADYRAVHAAYGSMSDFRRFVREVHRRGLRVITELVINHTSDQHPRFQRARRAAAGSAHRDWYVWSDNDRKYAGTRVIFLDTEASNWSWDPEAKAYYWHRFYAHQPDLNFANPRVLREVIRIMEFWLDIGVDGLRLDAIPYLCERDGTNNENLPETHAIIRQIRAEIDRRYPDRMLLGEANQWPEDVSPYFGNGDECHMNFHFPLMPRIYMAVAQEDRHPVTDIIRQTPNIPEGCQWAIFLRNHDELTLEMVSDEERDYLWSHYATDTRARLNLGIRRRLAPLLENDRRKIELLNSLLMSMPGTPIIYYGDEIGMGDNIFLGDRDGVRTPMQWSPDRNGGFSIADTARLYLPPVTDPVYGFGAVNVEAQNRSPTSLLNWMKRLIAARRQQLAFGRGTLTLLYPGNRKVLAYVREWQDEVVLCVANLARSAQPVELDLSRFSGRLPVELLGNSVFPPIGELPYFITLPAYGFYWFALAREGKAPAWHEAPQPVPEHETLVLAGERWQEALSGEVSRALRERLLPAWIEGRRWFAAKGKAVHAVRLQPLASLSERSGHAFLTLLETKAAADDEPQLYALPLALAWQGAPGQLVAIPDHAALARIRRGPRGGLLADAMADEAFVRDMVEAMKDGRTVPTIDGGKLVFAPTAAFDPAYDVAAPVIDRTPREQSNTSVRIGDDGVLKLYRRLQPGPHPEIEMGRYLTEVVHFAQSPPLLGSLRYEAPDGTAYALATLVAFVRNQGDGWGMTQQYLARFLEDTDILPAEAQQDAAVRHAHYMLRMTTLGRRTAELHKALATSTDDPAFAPEKVTARDLAHWKREVRRQARASLATLARARGSLTPEDAEPVRQLLARRRAVAEAIESALPQAVEAVKIRCHGDLHLGQVLVAQDDFYFVDFEGEPSRDVGLRRTRQLPLRDVAGMLRSFDYAAAIAPQENAALRAESRAAIVAAAADWRQRARQAYLDAYNAAIEGCPAHPADAKTARQLLDFFLLEKTLYEIAYECANRPRHVGIPVAGLLAMLDEAS